MQLLLVAALAVALHPAHVAAQELPATRHDVIRGRVTGADGRPVRGADVVVTVAPTAETLMAVTDSAGAYRVAIEHGTGEYLLYVAASGRRAVRQRVTIAGRDSVAVIDARLVAGIAELDAVKVLATKPRPGAWAIMDRRGQGQSGDKDVDGIVGLVTPDQEGSIEALAATVPGIALTPDGLSTLGSGPGQTLTTLDGLAFTGGSLPRDAFTTVHVQPSPWDPALGGFSGALIATSLAPGGRYTTRRAHLTIDAPALQSSGASAPRLGQEFTHTGASAGGTGALVPDAVYYNYGVDVARRWSDASSLVDVDRDALAHAGVAADSVRRLLAVLDAQRIPITYGRVPTQRATETASFVTRIDGYEWTPLGSDEPPIPRPQWWLSATGQLSRSNGLGLDPTAGPASGGRSAASSASVRGEYRAYVGPWRRFLSVSRSAVSLATQHGTPYLATPAASVVLTSALPDGTTGLGTVRAGGNAGLARDARRWSWEATNQTAFLLGRDPFRPLRLYLQARYEAYDESPVGDPLGTFRYASLADVAANQPASFTRTFGGTERRGGEWIGAAALGFDRRRRFANGTSVSVTGGVRADAQAFTGAPAANPALERAFGVRSNVAPHAVALSPRLGVTWTDLRRRGASSMGGGHLPANGSVGQSTIHGGVGLFRNSLPATLLAEAGAATGSPNDLRRLTCLGPAVPTPDWSAFSTDTATVPTTCVGGATPFADATPAVQLVAPDFRAPASWRTQLGWSDARHGVYFSVDGTLAWNRAQPSAVDLNFAGRERFTLGDEAGRPVYVSPGSIVPGTGLVAPAESRRVADFGRVVQRRSDLAATARQVTLLVRPDGIIGRTFWSVDYTLQSVAGSVRGFDGQAAGDPRTLERTHDATAPRHLVQFQLGRQFRGVTFTSFTRVTSGRPFTPVVAGDVNGDGVSGDRGFVFDPARVADPALAAALRTLLHDAPGDAAACLARQLGRIAARASCRGPWSATMNASLLLTRGHVGRHRTMLQLSFDNPLGGVDQLLHGDALRGWGGPMLPDATLYRVRGFDPAELHFLYEVNPRFGAARPSTTTLLTPFRVSVDVSIQGWPDAQQGRLARAMRPARLFDRRRPAADIIARRLATEGFLDVYQPILTRADTLALTAQQIEQLVRAQRRLRERADSVFAAAGARLAALPARSDRKAAARDVETTNAQVWRMILDDRLEIARALTFRQIQALPTLLLNYVIGEQTGRFYPGR